MTFDGGGVVSTPARGELLDGELPDALVRRFLEGWLGPAHALSWLAEPDGPATEARLVTRIAALHPGWTSREPARRVVAWLDTLGLTGDDAGSRALTDYGRAWAARLPEDLPRTTPSESTDTALAPAARLKMPPIDRLRPRLETARLVVDAGQLDMLHFAWQALDDKRFAVLSGLSGTGKTAIVCAYAEAVCAELELDPREHLAVVPVSPDWRDPAGLLGYLNPLGDDPRFHREPALDLVLRATDRPDAPFFLLLDEMNLARVERYFAPFLSAMETGERLRLHTELEPVDGVPPSVQWPRNLFIAGTVNMDESTHTISDKVLDRAYTLEFWHVDLPAYFAGRTEPARRHDDAEAVLVALYNALVPARRHFGYRTAGEVLALMDRIADEGLDADRRRALLDRALFAKVLPRLRGQDEPRLRGSLEGAHAALAGFSQCRQKLEAMTERLDAHGITQFWS